MADRELEFWDDTGAGFRKVVRDWPAAVKKAIGADIRRVQRGEEPMNWKPLTGFPVAAAEIRHRGGARVVYCITYASISGKVFIVDAFMKDSRDRSAMRNDVRERIEARLKRHRAKYAAQSSRYH